VNSLLTGDEQRVIHQKGFLKAERQFITTGGAGSGLTEGIPIPPGEGILE